MQTNAPSAAAGNALELNSNVFASRNHCFEEWKKFTGEAFYSFDMGNYMELAEKIQSMPDKKKHQPTKGCVFGAV